MASLVHMFPLTSPWCKEQDSSSKHIPKLIESLNAHTFPCIIFGENQIGKTTLLFQAAVSYANKDVSVLYICHQPLTKMPLGVHGMPHPDAQVLRNVKFIYMKKTEELIEYCSSVHTKPVLPDVIIIDDVDIYLEQMKEDGIEHGTAKLCALLVDATTFIKGKNDSKHCQLVLSCKDNLKYLQTVFRKFKFSVTHLNGCTDKESVYKLDFKSRDTDISLLYKMDGSGLYLHSVTEQEKIT